MRFVSLACWLLFVTGCESNGPRCDARLQPINTPAVSALAGASTAPAADATTGKAPSRSSP
jgi:hypothetical protein